MKSRTCAVLLLNFFSLFLSRSGKSAQLPDFSGKYTVTKTSGPQRERGTGTLNVVQSSDQIQIARTWRNTDGSFQESNAFPLNGRETVYTTSSGVKGKGSVKFKGKYLFIRTIVVSRPDPSQPPVEIDNTERWELSKDSQTLTVKTNTHFPSVPFLDMSSIEKYVRE